ncbi:hypothetical protein WSM22_04230 [Cytophagales bacterium WSM2-2]|nr:hypothetical protein WSM22_04230 [Cytophagales bacterium WSM2-2]
MAPDELTDVAILTVGVTPNDPFFGDNVIIVGVDFINRKVTKTGAAGKKVALPVCVAIRVTKPVPVGVTVLLDKVAGPLTNVKVTGKFDDAAGAGEIPTEPKCI